MSLDIANPDLHELEHESLTGASGGVALVERLAQSDLDIQQ